MASSRIGRESSSNCASRTAVARHQPAAIALYGLVDAVARETSILRHIHNRSMQPIGKIF
jgi:hypothetical protein